MDGKIRLFAADLPLLMYNEAIHKEANWYPSAGLLISAFLLRVRVT